MFALFLFLDCFSGIIPHSFLQKLFLFVFLIFRILILIYSLHRSILFLWSISVLQNRHRIQRIGVSFNPLVKPIFWRRFYNLLLSFLNACPFRRCLGFRIICENDVIRKLNDFLLLCSRRSFHLWSTFLDRIINMNLLKIV